MAQDVRTLGENSQILNLDAIKITALTAVHRASLFMGLGVNAADNPDFTNYKLEGPIQISVTPEVSDAELSVVKGHFKHWIIGNGLRELTERFGEFLDQLFSVSMIIEVHSGLKSPETADKLRTGFLNDTAISSKIGKLTKDWGVSIPNRYHYDRLTQARNCLVHGLGIVRERDRNDGDELVISWRGGDVYLHGEDGTEFKFSEETVGRIAIGDATFRASDRERGFAVGTEVVLTPHDLQEICAMVQRDTEEMLRILLRHGESRGVKHLQDEMRAT